MRVEDGGKIIAGTKNLYTIDRATGEPPIIIKETDRSKGEATILPELAQDRFPAPAGTVDNHLRSLGLIRPPARIKQNIVGSSST